MTTTPKPLPHTPTMQEVLPQVLRLHAEAFSMCGVGRGTTDKFYELANRLQRAVSIERDSQIEKCHSSHVTRISDASSFDEICTNCGATDITGGGWGKLAEPCPKAAPAAEREKVELTVDFPRQITLDEKAWDELQRGASPHPAAAHLWTRGGGNSENDRD